MDLGCCMCGRQASGMISIRGDLTCPDCINEYINELTAEIAGHERQDYAALEADRDQWKQRAEAAERKLAERDKTLQELAELGQNLKDQPIQKLWEFHQIIDAVIAAAEPTLEQKLAEIDAAEHSRGPLHKMKVECPYGDRACGLCEESQKCPARKAAEGSEG